MNSFEDVDAIKAQAIRNSALGQILFMSPHPLPTRMMRFQSSATKDDSDDKLCPQCDQILAPAEFYQRADGRCSAWCKKCTSYRSNETRKKRLAERKKAKE